MCACDHSFTCAACAGTHRDDRYPELPDYGADDDTAKRDQLAHALEGDDR